MIHIEILKYDHIWNCLTVRLPDGTEDKVDPFVGCNYELTVDEYMNGKASDLEGKIAEIDEDFDRINGVIVPYVFNIVDKF